MRPCRACGHEHAVLMRCDVAARIRAVHEKAAVAANTVVANAEPVANKARGKYADPVKRREYMRTLMAARRAKARAAA